MGEENLHLLKPRPSRRPLSFQIKRAMSLTSLSGSVGELQAECLLFEYA